jgi:DNA invertase Pin-like site-specific DNA recombinase
MRIGYARVSTDEQHLDLQLDALRIYGCDEVITDQGVSGARFDRPGLLEVLARLQPGDTLVVWRLDRLGRSISELVKLMAGFREQSIQFASLQESINTDSPTGMFMFHMIAALAEFERALIGERTRAGLVAARQRGRTLGRPHALDAARLRQAREWLQTVPLCEVAQRLEVHPRTLQRYLRSSAAQPDTDPPHPSMCELSLPPLQPGSATADGTGSFNTMPGSMAA